MTRAPLAVLAATLLAVTACTSGDRGATTGWSSGLGPASSDGGASDGGCVVAAAGDVAGREDYRTGAARTADLISSARPEAVLALGDLAYDDGTPAEFADYYDPTWGAFKDITVPTPGNHEYRSDGKGYFDYFDVDSHHTTEICGWRVVSVDQYAGMDEAVAFVEEEVTAAGGTPSLVFWHEPRFSSGSEHGSESDLQPLWAAAVAAGADIVLGAHDHHYERFRPMDVNGNHRADGTVQFVSGNGGHNLRELDDRERHSSTAVAGTPGVLFLTLRSDRYHWSYRDVEGRTGDSGTRRLP